MKKILKKIKKITNSNIYKTGFRNYTENSYGRVARITDEEYRKDLVSWQIPAIKKHFGDLTNKSFIDVGAGDIVLGEFLYEIGIPKIFYAQDLSEISLKVGMDRIKKSKINPDIFVTMSSDNFDFSKVEDFELDYAFSNSLFSHLSINSILFCLRKLSKKMKIGGKYLTSMIILPTSKEEESFDWSFLKKKHTDVISHSTKDPFHYSEETIMHLSSFSTGFKFIKIHDYGHPFQKLVEFERF